MNLAELRERLRRGLDLSDQEAGEALGRVVLALTVGDLVEPDPAVEKRPYYGGVLSPAVAAEYTMHQLWNPVASGVLLRIRMLVVRNAASARLYRCGVNATENVMVGTAFDCGPADTRRAMVRHAAVLYHGSAAGLVGGTANMMNVYGDTLDRVKHVPDGFFVIAPGYSLLLQDTTVNDASDVRFFWTEEPYLRPA